MSVSKTTVKFEQINVVDITCTELVDMKSNEQAILDLKLKTAYLNYKHPNGKPREPLQVLFPWTDLNSHGVAKEGVKYYKDTLQIPLTDKNVLAKLKEMDAYFDSDEFKEKILKKINEENKNDKKKSKKPIEFTYTPLVRDGFTSETGNEYPESLIVKLDLKLEPKFYEMTDEKSQQKQLVATTQADIRAFIPYRSRIRPIVRFCSFQGSNSKWTVVSKLVGCNIIPCNEAVSKMISNCDLLSDDENDNQSQRLIKPVESKKSEQDDKQVAEVKSQGEQDESTKAPSKTIKQAQPSKATVATVSTDDDDEDDKKSVNNKKQPVKQNLNKNYDSDDDEDAKNKAKKQAKAKAQAQQNDTDGSDEEVVVKKPQPTKGGKARAANN